MPCLKLVGKRNEETGLFIAGSDPCSMRIAQEERSDEVLTVQLRRQGVIGSVLVADHDWALQRESQSGLHFLLPWFHLAKDVEI